MKLPVLFLTAKLKLLSLCLYVPLKIYCKRERERERKMMGDLNWGLSHHFNIY